MSANRAQTGMTSEALGVSVAPSFFQSCVADGKTACMEDVMRFKVLLWEFRILYKYLHKLYIFVFFSILLYFELSYDLCMSYIFLKIQWHMVFDIAYYFFKCFDFFIYLKTLK